MSRYALAHAGALTTAAIVVLSLAPVSATGETQNREDASWTVPRTPWGDPDLQGLWNNSTTTPLERPTEYANKEFLTPEELAALDQAARDRADQPPRPGDTGSYNGFWFNRGNLLTRTSLIVDPADGRLPPMTLAGETRATWERGTDSWVDRNLAERCVTRGAPKRPGGYNNNFLIMQTPGYVAILQEMIHEVRFISLDERPPLPDGVRQWMGDSRGRWEGDTLVVETRNFRNLGTAHPAPNMALLEALGPQLHLVERFTRQDADTLLYQFTVNDPTAFTTPWSVEMTMTKTENALYEYACHEGNYGLFNILAGAQADERSARAAKSGSR